jgi:hypothetical protein
LFENECIAELDSKQRKYIGDTFSELIAIVNWQFLEDSFKQREETRLELFFAPYIYCIEKGIEVAYNLRYGYDREFSRCAKSRCAKSRCAKSPDFER